MSNVHHVSEIVVGAATEALKQGGFGPAKSLHTHGLQKVGEHAVKGSVNLTKTAIAAAAPVIAVAAPVVFVVGVAALVGYGTFRFCSWLEDELS